MSLSERATGSQDASTAPEEWECAARSSIWGDLADEGVRQSPGRVTTHPFMHHDVLPISELTPRDLSAWRELAGDALSPNPFAEPDLVLPATQAWGADGVQLLVVRDGSE